MIEITLLLYLIIIVVSKYI